MDVNDIEVLPDGRIVLVLHSGHIKRPMSTHEVKKSFILGIRDNSLLSLEAFRFAEFSRTVVLK